MVRAGRLRGSLTYANVTATLALVVALGGGAAAATTLIDGSPGAPATRSPSAAVGALEIGTATERVVGAPGQPPFGSGWKDAGGGYQLAGFFRDREGIVRLRGEVALGGGTMTIFTLPAGFRPAAGEAFSAALDNAGSALILVTAAGDVDLEFIDSPATPHSLSLSQISFRAGI